MHRPARLTSSHHRRVQRRRARLANPAARRTPSSVAADPATTPAAWAPPTGLPDASLAAEQRVAVVCPPATRGDVA